MRLPNAVSTGTSEGALQHLLDDGCRVMSSDPDHVRLCSALSAAAAGGKRRRPTLLGATYEALGGTDAPACAVLGAAVELLHTAFVIHDDVIDGEDVRRGRPNVTGRFARDAAAAGVTPATARRYGEAASILAGDLALARALRAVATCPASPRTVRRLLDLVDRALHITAVGELTDVRLGLGVASPALAEVLTMAERKTAVYSFELPLQAGAVLAEAPDPVVEQLGEAGRLVGIAFQLLDDVQGIFGNARVTGKSALTDLREGKQTALLAHARTTGVWEQICSELSGPAVTETQAATVRALLTECGSRAFVEDLAVNYIRTARGILDDLRLPGDLASVLASMADILLESAA